MTDDQMLDVSLALTLEMINLLNSTPQNNRKTIYNRLVHSPERLTAGCAYVLL